jgi:hypothetical protein
LLRNSRLGSRDAGKGKLGTDGKNVNELTSQKLTDMGRAPVFYDCAVQVAAA